MSLKDLIRTLIESAFTSKKAYISNQSMPQSAVSYTYYTGNDTAQKSYVAVSDGYVSVIAVSSSGNNELYAGSGNLNNGSCATTLGWGVRTFVPVHKGQQFNVYGSGMTNMTVRHIPTIGVGGG